MIRVDLSWIACCVVFCAASVWGDERYSFALKDSDGRFVALEEFEDSDVVVVAFLGVDCPLVKLYASRLNEIHRQFVDQSVSMVAINSNQQDSLAEIQHFVRSFELAFPVLKDVGNEVADRFDAERTPEVFVLNKQRDLVYRGVIDDQYGYGVQRTKADRHFLVDAINVALQAKRPETAQTQPVGCIIGRRRPTTEHSAVTYTNQISRILQNHCVSCHRAGEIAPFALDEYEEVAGWAGMIEEVVREQRMPPWHADPDVGEFSNDARVADEDKQLIYDWVAAGAPEGDPLQLPAPREYPEGWQIGKPDVVIEMSDEPFMVKSRGAVPYQYFAVDPGFTEDKWVWAAECRPGNRAVVHHIIVGVAGEGEFGRGGGVHGDLQSEWIAATAPGARPMVLPDGYAKLLPANTKLIFQMHYTPNGTQQTDLSKIGLIFIDSAEVTHRVATLMAFEDDFAIPPGAPNHPVSASLRISQPVELLALFPHMHYRGKSFRYELRLPNGAQETLLSVPNYDFNWQNSYLLAKSRMLPAGSRIRCEARFDNSDRNLANPDPTRTVHWGDQTWEEMMIGYFDVAIPIERPANSASPAGHQTGG